MDELSDHSMLTVAAYRRYFDLYYEKIRNFCYYKCGDMPLAEDITQEVFLQVWRNRSEIREETIANLLYTVAGNQCKNAIRHEQVVYRFTQETQKDRDTEDPSYLLEMQQFHEQLEAAISALPSGAREVFLMNRIDKLKYAEIANRLGLSIKAVEKRMHIALKQLKKLTQHKI